MIEEPKVRITRRTLGAQLLLDYPGLSARDCVHAAVMQSHEMDVIASFDTGFDLVAGIRRLDLQDLP